MLHYIYIFNRAHDSSFVGLSLSLNNNTQVWPFRQYEKYVSSAFKDMIFFSLEFKKVYMENCTQITQKRIINRWS